MTSRSVSSKIWYLSGPVSVSKVSCLIRTLTSPPSALWGSTQSSHSSGWNVYREGSEVPWCEAQPSVLGYDRRTPPNSACEILMPIPYPFGVLKKLTYPQIEEQEHIAPHSSFLHTIGWPETEPNQLNCTPLSSIPPKFDPSNSKRTPSTIPTIRPLTSTTADPNITVE